MGVGKDNEINTFSIDIKIQKEVSTDIIEILIYVPFATVLPLVLVLKPTITHHIVFQAYIRIREQLKPFPSKPLLHVQV